MVLNYIKYEGSYEDYINTRVVINIRKLNI